MIKVCVIPNPNAIKFLFEQDVIGLGYIFYEHQDDVYVNDILTKSIFQISGIQKVFYGKNFITITKYNSKKWNHLINKVLYLLYEYFKDYYFIIKIDNHDINIQNIDSSKSKVEEKIQKVIDLKIKPAISLDGGDILFKSFNDGVVYIELMGACVGCPSANLTLKHGIEHMLKYFVSEVKKVETFTN